MAPSGSPAEERRGTMPGRMPASPLLWLGGMLCRVLAIAMALPGHAAQGQPTGAAQAEPMILIPAGAFLMGSTAKERAYALALDEARGSTAARRYRWFENEARRRIHLGAYLIDKLPVTNRQYQAFVTAGGAAPPGVTASEWVAFGLIHPYDTVTRFLWRRGRHPPGRGAHPVVLVNHEDAQAFCRWRGAREGRDLRLPSEAEWEKAARGPDGRVFPWGDRFDAGLLNSLDRGPYDTVAVGRFPSGASPYGVQDMAGMVFEWTASVCPADPGRFIVKGGSWDDYPGVTRPAARHCRPRALRHILIGFRCAADARAP